MQGVYCCIHSRPPFFAIKRSREEASKQLINETAARCNENARAVLIRPLLFAIAFSPRRRVPGAATVNGGS